MERTLDKRIFRSYDIRGEYPTQLNDNDAYQIGRALATIFKSNGNDTCVVGHDNRLSGEVLTENLIKGINEGGVNVKYIGLVTTPMLYFASLYLKIESAVMVTASHNPVNDNGFKISFKNYNNACGEDITRIYDIIMNGKFTTGSGTVEEINVHKAYFDLILSDVRIKKKLKVVFDPANGVAATIIRDICDHIGVDAIYINDYSDGSFPSHHPDPSEIENMQQLAEKVKEVHADCGIGYDGDADRLGVVDENGQVISIDTLMAIIIDDLINKVEDKTFLYDVKCSKQLEDEIIRVGGKPYMYRTGASYTKNKTKELDLAFGGELSGHIFFRDRWTGIDDGIYNSIRFLEILSNTRQHASELSSHMNKYYSTPEIRVKVLEENKNKVVEEVKDYATSHGYEINDIDGVRINYPDGWALVRASNTGPNLTLRFESMSEDKLNIIKGEYLKIVNKYKTE